MQEEVDHAVHQPPCRAVKRQHSNIAWKCSISMKAQHPELV